MTPALDSRLRRHRRRALVRSWEYRQRHHAHGVWFRLRRVLTQASTAHVVSRDDAERLVAEGHRPESIGREVDPPKLILFATPDRIARIPSARPVAVRLSAELLSAECLVLAPFERRRGPGG